MAGKKGSATHGKQPHTSLLSCLSLSSWFPGKPANARPLPNADSEPEDVVVEVLRTRKPSSAESESLSPATTNHSARQAEEREELPPIAQPALETRGTTPHGMKQKPRPRRVYSLLLLFFLILTVVYALHARGFINLAAVLSSLGWD